MDTTAVDADRWIRETYGKLHRIARSQMVRENHGHTLSATALIHEVYVRLNQSAKPRRWQNEREFLGVVAMEMRRVLIDSARRKKTAKRGHEWSRESLTDVAEPKQDIAQSIIDLSDSISRLEQIAPAKAELVKLRYLLGLTEVEAAETLGISRATAARYWAFARAWLLDDLAAQTSSEPESKRPHKTK